MNSYLEKNGILSEHQSGFRSKHSCTTAILRLTEDIHKSITNGKCVIVILLDFKNAFGSVDHDTLIQTLQGVGVQGQTLNWYSSFLTGWEQSVKYKEKLSEPITIERGIIQGENNSQTLFSLFINNLVKYIRIAKIKLFAVDVQIHLESEITAINDGIKIINDELANVSQFGTEYGIGINPSKTEAMIISSKNTLHKLKYDELPDIVIDGSKIEYVSEARNLGYFLNRTLTNEAHINIVRKKVYGSLNAIRPLKKILTTENKLQLIKTLVYPIIDYMDVVYHEFGVHGTRGNSESLEKLLNCCIRFVLNVKRHEHITPYRKELKMLPLFDRRTVHIAGMIHKILNCEAPPYLNDIITVNNNNMRSQNKLIIQKPMTNFHKTSMHVGGPRIWNDVPQNIREIAIYETFISELREYFLNKA